MASVEKLSTDTLELWRPPPRRDLSDWAEEFFYLSAESAADPGPWHSLPYQRGVMNAITEPAVRQVTLMKSARIGATKIMNATIGYYMHQDPCPIMIVQPTVEDAKGYSKEEIAPMIRDCPVLAALVPETSAKDSANTLLHKQFPGGSLSMVGANSARGFRRVSRKVVIFDEADGYPMSAGNEGDPVKLGMQRSAYYWDRKTYVASTPGIAGRSRIAELFEQGDQRRFFVPCPHCGHFDHLVFKEGGELGGHFFQFEKKHPAGAHFVCSKNGCVIEHKDKRSMVGRGEWRARERFTGHASFHIWAAYSFGPNVTWGHIAAEFLEANAGGPEKLKVFVNTTLGETWKDRGDAPEWRRLYDRRERYPIGTVPAGALFLTAGVDVQRDRLVWEVVGWGENRESWSIDAGVFPGDTSAEPVWARLDELLAHSWLGPDSIGYGIVLLGIDSGYNTQTVYSWAMRHPLNRVVAMKGVATARVLVGAPSSVDVKPSGKKIGRGYKVWPVGVGIAKSEFYGWLRQERPIVEGVLGAAPPGFCHFPEYGEDYFLQITAEHLVAHQKKSGFVLLEWQLIPGRENHFLDCRVYARAAAAVAGLDRLSAAARARTSPSPTTSPATGRRPPRDTSAPSPIPGRRGNWLGGRGARRDSWLNRKR
jgi:phage terminase large subunit GpA-like protein